MRNSSTLSVLFGCLLLRWILATDPGYVYDVLAYKRWAIAAAEFGISGAYEHSDFDYPPLYAYILYPLGKIYQWLSPAAFAAREDTTLFSVLIKLPPLVADLAIAGMLYRFGQWVRRGGWGQSASEAFSPSWERWAKWIPFLYLLNPAVIFDGGYWGQPDSIHSFFVLAAFLALGWSDRAWTPWVLLSLATLMKPLGAPFFPLLGILSIAQFGVRRTLGGVTAAAATVALALLPFILAGNLSATLERITGDVGLMAYTSTNAHNLWWLLGGWRDAEAPWLGPITATQVSLILFTIFYSAILAKGHFLHRRRNPPTQADLTDSELIRPGIQHPQMLGLAFLVGFGFFMIATHMHENHLFMAMPLALPLILIRGALGTKLRYVYFAVTLGVLLNLLLHDLDLPNQAPLTWGGDSSILNAHMDRPFAVFELWAIRFSMWWNLILFAGLLVTGLRRDGWLDRLGDDGRGRRLQRIDKKP